MASTKRSRPKHRANSCQDLAGVTSYHAVITGGHGFFFPIGPIDGGVTNGKSMKIICKLWIIHCHV